MDDYDWGDRCDTSAVQRHRHDPRPPRHPVDVRAAVRARVGGRRPWVAGRRDVHRQRRRHRPGRHRRHDHRRLLPSPPSRTSPSSSSSSACWTAQDATADGRRGPRRDEQRPVRDVRPPGRRSCPSTPSGDGRSPAAARADAVRVAGDGGVRLDRRAHPDARPTSTSWPATGSCASSAATRRPTTSWSRTPPTPGATRPRPTRSSTARSGFGASLLYGSPAQFAGDPEMRDRTRDASASSTTSRTRRCSAR